MVNKDNSIIVNKHEKNQYLKKYLKKKLRARKINKKLKDIKKLNLKYFTDRGIDEVLFEYENDDFYN